MSSHDNASNQQQQRAYPANQGRPMLLFSAFQPNHERRRVSAQADCSVAPQAQVGQVHVQEVVTEQRTQSQQFGFGQQSTTMRQSVTVTQTHRMFQRPMQPVLVQGPVAPMNHHQFNGSSMMHVSQTSFMGAGPQTSLGNSVQGMPMPMPMPVFNAGIPGHEYAAMSHQRHVEEVQSSGPSGTFLMRETVTQRIQTENVGFAPRPTGRRKGNSFEGPSSGTRADTLRNQRAPSYQARRNEREGLNELRELMGLPKGCTKADVLNAALAFIPGVSENEEKQRRRLRVLEEENRLLQSMLTNTPQSPRVNDLSNNLAYPPLDTSANLISPPSAQVFSLPPTSTPSWRSRVLGWIESVPTPRMTTSVNDHTIFTQLQQSRDAQAHANHEQNMQQHDNQ